MVSGGRVVSDVSVRQWVDKRGARLTKMEQQLHESSRGDQGSKSANADTDLVERRGDDECREQNDPYSSVCVVEW